MHSLPPSGRTPIVSKTVLSVLLALSLMACGDDATGVNTNQRDAASTQDAAAPDAASTQDADLADAAPADAALTDAAPDEDAATPDAAMTPDAAIEDAALPLDAAPDATIVRHPLLPGYCPTSNTAPGYYQGTLAGNLNDLPTNSCTGASPGRDGAVRLSLAPGQTVTAVYRHDGDGILYLLDSCPVTTSCLVGSDATSSGPETITWTNNGASANPVYLVLDSASLTGPQTFELDLFVTP